MNSFQKTALLALAAGALVLAGCGTDTNSCASQSATWTPGTNTCDDGSGLAPGVAFDVTVKICQADCETSPSCAVDVQGGTIQLDPIVHTCDQSSCGLPSCAAAPNVICHVPGLAAGNYSLLVGADSAGTVVVGGSATSCAI